MQTTTSHFLLPRDYTASIQQPASPQDDPDVLQASVTRHDSLKHPTLTQTDPWWYRVPATTALFLYRRRPDKHRQTALNIIGSPQLKHFSLLIAAVARDAYDQQDWSLLGQLAWILEAAMPDCSHGEWANLGETATARTDVSRQWQLKPGKLQSAFVRMLDYRKGHIAADAYTEFALSYFRSIPDHFVFPTDWISLSGSNPDGGNTNQWTVLRLLCRQNGGAWQAVPQMLKQAATLQHPFLRSAVTSLEKQKPGTASPPVSLKNPFHKLATSVGEDPAKGMFGRLMRKVTGRESRAEPALSPSGTEKQRQD